MLKAKVHNAKVQDREGIKILVDLAPKHLPRLSHPWMDAGYTGEGKGEDWVERVLGWTAQIVPTLRRWLRRSSRDREGSGICLVGGW